MTLRLRALVLVLVAGLLNPTGPAVSATQASPARENAGMHCAGDMTPASPSDPCPCCPDGPMGSVACLSACTATVGAISTVEIFPAQTYTVPIAVLDVQHVARASDPPLKPPPIV